MKDEEMIERGFEKKKVRLVFKYKDKEYIVEKEEWISKEDWPEENPDWNWYWWEEGNGSCDDNKSIAIHEQFPDFPVFEHCGKEIELIDYDVL